MKQLLISIACIFASFSFLQAETKPKVVATASIFADMAAVIGGDLVEVSTIVPIGGDPHLHEPTPRDAKMVAEADLILKNGLTFEGWLIELIDNSGTAAPSVLITEGVDPISSLQYENATDPHAWMDGINGQIYLENIKNALIQLDPDNADIYTFNHQLYSQQLSDLHTWIAEQIQTIPEQRRILITSHDAFQYYGRQYGLQLESVLGTSTDAEVQTADIVRLNKVIGESKVPAVFIESTINPKLLEQLAKDNDIVVGGKLFADSIGDENSEAPSYLDMLRHNTETIVKALTRENGSTDAVSDESAGSTYWLWGILGFILVAGLIIVIRQTR